MSEGLFARVSRIISGSVNLAVDRAESAAPEVVMREAIREIDSATDDVRKQLGEVIARRHNASQRLASERERHEELSEQIRLALAEHREDLAEAAAATQLDVEAQLPILESSISEYGAEEAELENYIRALQGRKREMEAEAEQIIKAARAAQGQTVNTQAPGTGNVEAAVEKASDAFDRVASAATGAAGSVRSTDPAKLAELEELARKNRIRERLAQFKQDTND
ncbi:PspA/IM30 family protein [Parahaliea mediterranea]|uniref:PspA/IM30 family protein n=1 Tax=Parahaliea mediterranea TaxID=651086 RepID=A0A939DG41_9GAMM|nr:PspA/IM30 family protein [Parahaliea mediterranea]MBN7797633.1 PspA/IM30 family protein [Parahaliea mediterranea]